MSVRYNGDFKKEVVRTYMAGNKSTVQIAADLLPKVLLANGLTSTRKNAFIPLAQHLNPMKPRKSED
ncbi:hypothetical protein [Anaerostipes faecalis]|uniref:hypothetical protein n=1 Tax=Anaerostipes faecalis TaxID=2738446 RepID=UPI001C1E332B|nr:hypothetical protein [Anaerostipes faecalis]